jgi:hypothetical protein
MPKEPRLPPKPIYHFHAAGSERIFLILGGQHIINAGRKGMKTYRPSWSQMFQVCQLILDLLLQLPALLMLIYHHAVPLRVELFDFVWKDVLARSSLRLSHTAWRHAVIGIEKDDVRVLHDILCLLDPKSTLQSPQLPACWLARMRDRLGEVKGFGGEYARALKSLDGSLFRTHFGQSVENLFIKVPEMREVDMLPIGVGFWKDGGVPHDSKAKIRLAKSPDERQLAEITDVSNVSILHVNKFYRAQLVTWPAVDTELYHDDSGSSSNCLHTA